MPLPKLGLHGSLVHSTAIERWCHSAYAKPFRAILLSSAALFAVAGSPADGVDACPALGGMNDVFRSPAWLHTHLQAGNVSVLDARSNYYPHIRSAVQVSWQAFSVGGYASPAGGLLKPEAELRRQLQELGVSSSRTVVIYAEWSKGWGAEGRICWMLTLLGHKAAFVLDGGFDAFAALYPSDLTEDVPVLQAQDWSTDSADSASQSVSATKAELQSTVPFLVDTRTREEYEGSKKQAYGVKRDGHITRAVSFPFASLFVQREGVPYDCLRPCQELEKDLRNLGWSPGQRIVAYCTGGIRSAFFWAVTHNCRLGGEGLAANYPGSMWEWGADPSLPVTLGPNPVNSTASAAAESQFQLAMKSLAFLVAVLLESWSGGICTG